MRTPELFGVKNFGFFEIFGVSARTRTIPGVRVRTGVDPVRTFFGQGGREPIFRDFVRTSFMDGPLPILTLFLCISDMNKHFYQALCLISMLAFLFS